MKTIKIVLLFLIFAASIPSVHGENGIDIPNDVIVGIQNNEIGLITKHLNDNVEIVIANKNNIYSKQQASGILKSFFAKNKVNKISIIHKGNKGTSSFLIGKLETTNGNFRIHLLARTSNNQNQIQQIRIEAFD